MSVQSVKYFCTLGSRAHIPFLLKSSFSSEASTVVCYYSCNEWMTDKFIGPKQNKNNVKSIFASKLTLPIHKLQHFCQNTEHYKGSYQA